MISRITFRIQLSIKWINLKWIKYNEVQVLHRSSKHGKGRRQKILGSTEESLYLKTKSCQRSLLELSPADLNGSLVFNNSNNNSKELCWHSLQAHPILPPSLLWLNVPFYIRKAIWAKVLFYSFSKKYTFHSTLHRFQTMGAPLHRAWEFLLWKMRIYSVS